MNYTRIMRKLVSGVLFPILVSTLAGCGVLSSGAGHGGTGGEVFTAAVWNVQALFDGEEGGHEYGEYLEAAGWTAEKYAARITAVSQAVLRMIPDGAGTEDAAGAVPGIIGFTELENARVLAALAGGPLSQYRYSWTVFAGAPGQSLGTGFLSRYPIVETRVHSIVLEDGTVPRPVLELKIEPRGKPLVFLLCHWKSKLGGGAATEAQRRASARVVQRRIRELKETVPGTPVAVMGDLNENHDEFYRRGGNVLTALLPDDPDAAELAAQGGSLGSQADFLVLSGEKPPAASFFPDGYTALYSPWMEESGGGSYFYRGAWESIDHVLLSGAFFDSSGWEAAGCMVLNRSPFVSADGRPGAYIPRSGRGLSDHLPLLLYLRDTGP